MAKLKPIPQYPVTPLDIQHAILDELSKKSAFPETKDFYRAVLAARFRGFGPIYAFPLGHLFLQTVGVVTWTFLAQGRETAHKHGQVKMLFRGDPKGGKPGVYDATELFVELLDFVAADPKAVKFDRNAVFPDLIKPAGFVFRTTPKVKAGKVLETQSTYTKDKVTTPGSVDMLARKEIAEMKKTLDAVLEAVTKPKDATQQQG